MRRNEEKTILLEKCSIMCRKFPIQRRMMKSTVVIIYNKYDKMYQNDYVLLRSNLMMFSLQLKGMKWKQHFCVYLCKSLWYFWEISINRKWKKKYSWRWNEESKQISRKLNIWMIYRFNFSFVCVSKYLCTKSSSSCKSSKEKSSNCITDGDSHMKPLKRLQCRHLSCFSNHIIVIMNINLRRNWIKLTFYFLLFIF